MDRGALLPALHQKIPPTRPLLLPASALASIPPVAGMEAGNDPACHPPCWTLLAVYRQRSFDQRMTRLPDSTHIDYVELVGELTESFIFPFAARKDGF